MDRIYRGIEKTGFYGKVRNAGTKRIAKKGNSKERYDNYSISIPTNIANFLCLKKNQKLDIEVSKIPRAIIFRIREEDKPDFETFRDRSMKKPGKKKLKTKMPPSDEIRLLRRIDLYEGAVNEWKKKEYYLTKDEKFRFERDEKLLKEAKQQLKELKEKNKRKKKNKEKINSSASS